MKKIFIISLASLFVNILFAQETSNLTLEQVFSNVRQFHPFVKIAKINVDKTKADINIANAAFDPIVSTTFSSKTFGGTEYYNYTNPNITLPTWYGIELSAGIENLNGQRFDPSETVGQTSYIGISLPVLKNLIMDKRRAFLKQSRIFNNISKVEQEFVKNDILMQTASQYLEWVNAFETYKLTLKNFENNKTRLDWIKKSVSHGERPEIDIVEATTQLQNFEFLKSDSFLNYQKETIEMNGFLWQENDLPFQMAENTQPEPNWDNPLRFENFNLDKNKLLENAKINHPELQINKLKDNILNINKKLKFQELLPKLDLKYNQLSKDASPSINTKLLMQDNYQFGVKFEMPLFLSNGRGEFKQAKLKLEENKIAGNQKLNTIQNKIFKYFNEYENLKIQIELQKSLISNLKKLLKAEETLYENGESTLFLINSRENKVLETEKKLIDLKTKYIKVVYALQWSAGLLK
jgi:outer membrane protein TolC